MQSFIRSFTLFFVVAFTASVAHAASNTTGQAQPPVLTTPNGLTECKGYNFTWTHGKAPYTWSLFHGCDSSDADDGPIYVESGIWGNWLNWNVNVAEGLSVMFQIEDALGQFGYSDDVTIASGSTTCIGKNATWIKPPVRVSASDSLSIGSNPPTTAHPTGTQTGIANVASGGPNKQPANGASSLQVSGALAVLMAVIAVVASS